MLSYGKYRLLPAVVAFLLGTIALHAQTYPDFDGDNVADTFDIDDDNDGVLDTVERTKCPPTKYVWAVWKNFSANKATADIDVSGQTIGMTMVSNFNFGSTSGIYSYNKFNSFSDPVPNSTVPQTTWSAGAGGTTSMCFSQQVSDPILLISSLGNPGLTVNLSFSVPYTVLFNGGGMTFIDSITIAGKEGYAILRFPGNFKCVTINSTTPEYYTNITWGLKPPPCSTLWDTDGDGMPNYLDLDSDNDGCSDALEAGSTNKPDANYQFTGPVGSNGLVNSLETGTDNGYINYTLNYYNAINSAIHNCCSTVSVSLKTSGKDTICLGDSATLNAESIHCNKGAIKYTWDNDLGQGPSKKVAPQSTTTYKVIATDTVLQVTNFATITIVVAPPVQVSVSNDTLICKGSAAALKATPSGGLPKTYKVRWLNDITTVVDTNFNISVSPQVVTKYKAILNDGCKQADTAIVTVSIRPVPIPVISPDTTICIGNTSQLKITGTLPGGLKVLWTNDNNGWMDTSFNPAVSPVVTTVYKATFNYYCPVAPQFLTSKISVLPPLSISLNKDTTVCFNTSVVLKAKLAGGNAGQYKIRWYDDNGTWADSTSNSTSVSVWVTKTNTYRAVLSDGCTQQNAYAMMKVLLPPPLSILLTANDSVCAGKPVKLLAKCNGCDTPALKIAWKTKTTSWTSTQNPATDSPQATTWYIATGSDNCSQGAMDSIMVTAVPPPVADFSVWPAEACPPALITFTDNSQNHDTALNIWAIDTMQAQQVAANIYRYNTTGSYSTGLMVFNTFGCSNAVTKKNNIILFKLPVADFAILPASPEIEKPIFFENLSRRGITFLWDFDDGTTAAVNTYGKLQHTYNDTGNRTIQLIAITDKDCKDTIAKTIRIRDKYSCFVPNAFSPGNGDDYNNVFKPVCTGLKSYELIIFNRWGQVLLSCENCSWDGLYKGVVVPIGVYAYQLQIKAENGHKENLSGVVSVIR